MKKATKILLIVSLIIIVLGIVSGVELFLELTGSGFGNILVDGTNFTEIAAVFGYLGSGILAMLVFTIYLAVTISIWIVYGIILLIIKLVNKINNKKNNKKRVK